MPHIIGRIISATGETLGIRVSFSTLSAPTVNGDSFVSKTVAIAESDVEGVFSIDLQAGDYLVSWWHNNQKTELNISVPAGGGPYQITNLTTSNLVYSRTHDPRYVLSEDTFQSFRVRNGQLQFYNHTTELWHSIGVVGPAGMVQVSVRGEGEQ